MFYCVVTWNATAGRPDGYYMCSANRNNATRLRHRMIDRGMTRVRVIKRHTWPRGTEPVRKAMARWGLKPSKRMVKGSK